VNVSEEKATVPHCSFVNSIGQSGTHLAQKCLELLGLEYIPLATVGFGRVPEDGVPAFAQPDFDPDRHILAGVNWPAYVDAKWLEKERFAPHVGRGRFGASHILYTPAALRMLRDLKMRMVLILRDPRDHAYSHARQNAAKFPEKGINYFLDRAITGGGAILPIEERYRRVLGWGDIAVIVTFEDLVGSHGGGNDDASLFTIQKIADHVGINLDVRRRESIRAELFGGTETFRSGQIGRWRERADFFERPLVMAACNKAAAFAELRLDSRIP
jgi:hypothetical protein